MEKAAREHSCRESYTQGLHQADFEVTFDDSRLQTRADLPNFQEDALVQSVMFGGHAAVQQGNGDAVVGDHDVEELQKWPWCGFERRVGQEIGVTVADDLQQVRTGENNGVVFIAVFFGESDGSLTDPFNLLQTVIALQVLAKLFRRAGPTLISTETSIFQARHHAVVSDRSANVIRELVEDVMVNIVEGSRRHVRLRLHPILCGQDLKLVLSNDAGVILLDLQSIC